jgi:hypothetical protein
MWILPKTQSQNSNNKFFLFLKNNKLYKDARKPHSRQQRVPKQTNVANHELEQRDR